MGRDYAALRLWATVLVIIGVLGVVFVVIGTIFAMIEAVNLRALADVAEYVRDQQSRVR
jgi:hypothetical protein